MNGGGIDSSAGFLYGQGKFCQKQVICDFFLYYLIVMIKKLQ